MGRVREAAHRGLCKETWSCCGQDWSHEAAPKKGGQQWFKRLGPMGSPGVQEAVLHCKYVGRHVCVCVCVCVCMH
jgi:hypothetical protein